MMKKGKRIAALALSMVIALGSVCYKPPKAEAAIVESALASAAISTYLSATGFEFFGGGPSSPTEMNELLAKELTKLTQEFAASIEQLNDEVCAVITSGVTLLENGVVKFSASSANMLGRFSDWLINRFGLINDGVPTTGSVGVVPSVSDGFVSCNGFTVPAFPAYDTATYPYACIVNQDGLIQLFVLNKPRHLDSGDKYFGVYGDRSLGIRWHYSGTPSATNTWGSKLEDSKTTFCYNTEYLVWANYDVMSVTGSVYLTGSQPAKAEDWDNPVLSVSLPSTYEAPPTVDGQYAMVVDTGLTFADEQSYIDAVLNGVTAGTLSPTYTIEQATGGDVVVPDEDEERAGILNWVKNIAQSVKELPRTIADAVADVFVPSEEYLAVLPETIAVTFDGRTGILTYPTSVLYDFADRLTDGQQDFILSWPDIREPSTGGVMMEAGQFNVSKFVRDNQMLSDFYTIYQYAVGAYLTFLFFGLCSRKYNSIVGDISGV